jgi:hypothetical protein
LYCIEEYQILIAYLAAKTKCWGQTEEEGINWGRRIEQDPTDLGWTLKGEEDSAG